MAIRVGIAVGFITTFVGFLYMLRTESFIAHQHLPLDIHHPKIVKVNYSDVVDPNLNGSLVYLKGRLEVPQPIRLDEYKLSVHAVKLKRRVQMYQWSEMPKDRTDYLLDPLEEEVGGLDEAMLASDDMTYFKEWKDEVVNFTGKHASVMADIIVNPTFFPITNDLFTAPVVKVGAYFLSPFFVQNFFNRFKEITGDDRPEDPNIKLHGGLYYHTANIWDPQIGDVRIRFAFAGNGGLTPGRGTPVSVVAKVVGDTLHPYEDEKGRLVAILHEDWEPLHDIILLEKAARSRPQTQNRLLAVLTFSFGCSILLIYMDKLSLSAVITFSMMSYGLCWLFHWPYHGLGMIIFSLFNYYWVIHAAEPEEPVPNRGQKRRTP